MLWPWMLLGEGIGVCLIVGVFLVKQTARKLRARRKA